MRAGASVYGSSKAALTYFTRALVLDTQNLPVHVGFLSPGIVLTDLFTGGPDAELSESTKRIANILGDRVETVAPFLVEGMMSNEKHGAKIAWLTRRKIVWRFLSARFRRRDIFSED